MSRRGNQAFAVIVAWVGAIALDRNFAPAYGSLGDLLTWLGRPAETITVPNAERRVDRTGP